jgi:hypothetical protein
MTINRFRGDALPRPKIIKLLGPGGAGVVQAEITCGNRTFFFPLWNAINVAATLNASGVPEFTNVLFSALGDDVVATGPEDDDFIIGLAYRPTVNITNIYGVDRVNQISALNFNGAQAGTYTLTINGKTTGTITYGNQVDLITEIELLSGWTASDAVVRSATPDQILIEFAGTLAGIPVSVTMDASNLQNGRTMTVRERSPYRAEPHDIWMLGLQPSEECTITIDGNSATLRSDFGLEKTRELIQSLADLPVEVYGGYIAPEGRVAAAHYVLDFYGYSASTRPTVVLSSSTASPPSGVKIAFDATAGLIGYSILISPYSPNNFGFVRMVMLDFTAGDTIKLSYDGIEFEVVNDSGGVTASAVNLFSSHAAALNAILTTMRDVSEFTEATTYLTPTLGTDWILDSGSSPQEANTSGFHPLIYYILSDNGTLQQTGGDGTLRLLQQAGSASAPAVHEVFVPPRTTGGTFTLTFPEGKTAAISATASAATIETALDTLIAAGMGVAGSGTSASPWVITYTTALGARQLPIADDIALSGNGTGSASYYRLPVRSKNQSARIAISSNATGGTYKIAFGNDGPLTLTFGDSASTVDTALATLQGIGSAANVVTSYDAESQSYDLVFASALVNRKLPELKLISNNLDVTSTTTIEVSQQATGPQNLAEPQNWSANRVPHAGDTIVFESPVGDVRYGFRQWVQATANTTTEILTVAGGHDFRPGQVIRFLTSGTLPTGISAATDYYVLDPDNQNGTFRVSTTAAGGPVNISGAGSGEIFCGVLAAGVRIAGSFSDQIGRPERTAADSTEYLPRYLMIGLPSGGVCEIGAGVGRGTGLLRMDLGYSAGTVQLVRSDSSAETDRPAICLLSDSTLLAVDIVSADVGIAAHDGEVSTVGAVTQSAGTLYCGDVGVASIVKQGGRLLSRVMTVSGSVSIKG